MPTSTPLYPVNPLSKHTFLEESFLYSVLRRQQPRSTGPPIWSQFLNDPFFKIVKPTYIFHNFFSFHKCHHLKTYRWSRRPFGKYHHLPLVSFCPAGVTGELTSTVDSKVWFSQDPISQGLMPCMHCGMAKASGLSGIRTWASRAAFQCPCYI